ncbi:MAG TPA: rhomboid family intramembrane serine protease [Dongiaceae bacterium]|jgi:membrane associated rhomboid family serine protease
MANFSPQRSGGPFGSFGGGAHGPIINLPQMTKWLVIANLAIHLVRQFLPEMWDNWVLYNFSFIPLRYSQLAFFDWTAILGPVSSQFLHGGWLHVIMNMIMAMIFGSFVERSIGGRSMLILALVSGALGLVVHFAIYFGQPVPAIGFSGATSGLFGATLRLLNRRHTGRDTQQLWIFAAIWVGLSLLPALSPGSGIAWTVHVGGFLAGLLLIDSFDRRGKFRVM